MIARLRRQRQQREAMQQGSGVGHERRNERAEPENRMAVEPRFARGDRIFCLPYGNGLVRASRIEGGRELLTVVFPEHGELTIDPGVSLVRKLEDAPPADDQP